MHREDSPVVPFTVRKWLCAHNISEFPESIPSLLFIAESEETAPKCDVRYGKWQFTAVWGCLSFQGFGGWVMGCNVERGSWRIHCTNFWYHISPHASQRKSNNYTKSLILAKRLGRRPHFSSNIFSCKQYYFFFLNFCFSEKPEQSTHRVF